MWILVKNNIYSVRKVLIVSNLIAAIIGIIFSLKVKDGIIMAPLCFFIASFIGMATISKKTAQNKDYNLFINNFGIKRKEIVKGNMILMLTVSIMSILLGIVFTLIMNSINNELYINNNLNVMIIIIGIVFTSIVLFYEGVNYFNFKYDEDSKKNQKTMFIILVSCVIPQSFRLLDKIKIFKDFTIWNLSIRNSLIISLSLCIVGLIGAFFINKISQKNYEKREF